MEIGRLKEVDIRKLWKHEEYDFSNWLVENENISYLNEILGLTLTDIKREEHVGSFECDIFAKDETSDTNIIIENQLENSNHEHLGKIITYASGLDANVVVWIVKRAREEHKSAIEWLNNNTSSNVNFFLIELHAYQIGNSEYAPKFEVVEKPNDFIKNIKVNGVKNELNKSQSERLEFWDQFNDTLIERGKPFNVRKATTDHWYDVAIGTSAAHIAINLVNKESHICVELYINDDKKIYDQLLDRKKIIEDELGFTLDWQRLDNRSASRIKYYIKGLNFDDHSNYAELIENTINTAIKMRDVFKKYL